MSTVQGDDGLKGGAPPDSEGTAEQAVLEAPAVSEDEVEQAVEETTTTSEDEVEQAVEETTTTSEDEVEQAADEATSGPTPEQKARQKGDRRAQGAGGGRKGKAAKTEAREAPADGGAPAAVEATPPPKPRLLELYRSQVVPTMMQEFEYGNVMQVPRIRKVVLNIGLGEALVNQKAIESATNDLATISGQKPVVARARKSIANFKLREGNPIGLFVTLRGDRMYHFMDRLINMALPRIRDFRGISLKSFDGRGNYSMGIKEQIIFPEVDYGQIERIRGFQVTITTNARTDAEAARLLGLLGMPFASADSS